MAPHGFGVTTYCLNHLSVPSSGQAANKLLASPPAAACLRLSGSVSSGDTSTAAPRAHSGIAASGGSTTVGASYRASSPDRTDLHARFR